jgi:Cu(I)/Ag(I) efflux system membrane fusion protein
MRLAGLRTAVAARARLAPTLTAVGFVVADERSVVSVSVPFSGWIESLGDVEAGERVEQGALLATVFCPDTRGAQRSYLARSPRGEPAAGTEAEPGPLTQLVPVRAPIRGHVVRRAALRGSYVQPGVELFRLADLSAVSVVAEVYETEIARVRAGQRAVLETGAYPGAEFAGTVSVVEPAVAHTRALRVRIALPNPGARLRPGMFGEVTLHLGGREELVVPEDALLDAGEIQYVFVSRGGGRFEPRRVRLGEAAGGRVAILEGLAEGERVVTAASFLLDSESRLRAGVRGR